MKLPNWLVARLRWWAEDVIESRDPDEVIGDPDRPYMRRWHIVRRYGWFNLFVHEFLRSDDDRALHDHPWANVSLMLDGEYREWTPIDCPIIDLPRGSKWDANPSTSGIVRGDLRKEGELRFRRAGSPHRIELLRSWYGKNISPALAEKPCITLFMTGPKVREWGFLCRQGWKHWQDFIHNNGCGKV